MAESRWGLRGGGAGRGPPADSSYRRRWIILGVVFLYILSLAVALQSVPPVLSLIMAELELSHAQGGSLMSLFALPGIILSIPAGMLTDRYSQKAIGLASLSLMIIGVAVLASGNSLLVMGLGRVVSGIGAAALGVLLPQLLAQWFVRREIGVAMGVFSAAMPLGTILCLSLLSLAAESVGWRSSIWISIALPVLTLVVFALLFTSAPVRSEPAARRDSFRRSIRLAERPVWTIGIAWLLFNAAVFALFTFTPDLLKESGFSVARSGFLAGAVMWPALVFSPILGYAIDRIDRKRLIIALGGFSLAVLIVLVPGGTGWILGLMLLIGVAQTMVPAPILALLPEVTRPERLGLGYGILATCLNTGVVVGPTLAGLIRDLSGSYQSSYVLLSGLALLISATVLTLRQPRVEQGPAGFQA